MDRSNRRDFLKLSTGVALAAAELGEAEGASRPMLRTATRPGVAGNPEDAGSVPLMAGVAQVDITPPPGLVMYGYFSRIKNNIVATGTLDPLYARVLVLATRNTRLALVTLDLGRVFGKPLLDRLRQEASTTSSISHLVVTASHTHSGPNILDIYPPGQTPEWETAAVRKIEAAINKACQKLAPVRIGVGYGTCSIGFNRIMVNPDGTVKMLWVNPTRVPTAPVDPTVGVIRVDNMDERPVAVLVNYACHPTIFGDTNLEYSADWPGVMIKTVEQAFGGESLCMFLQGACGDINPYYSDSTLVNGAAKYRDWTGETLGREVLRVAQGIQTRADSTPSLQFAEDVLPVKLRWNPVKFRDGLLNAFGPKVFEDHTDLMVNQAVATLEMPITALLINKQIALAGISGEPFVDFQIDFRTRCPVHAPFLMGYTNGYFDYIPTIKAASRGGYGAGDSNTYVALGTGERFVLHSVMSIYGMLGTWYELPEDLRGPSAGDLPSNQHT
jgi:neutral ceramidase